MLQVRAENRDRDLPAAQLEMIPAAELWNIIIRCCGRPAMRQLMPQERQLLEHIAAGELDQQLVAIADAVEARLELLHTVRSANALAELSVGDAVMFTARVRPRYLEHELAVIEAMDDRSVTVRLWRPAGRFRDGAVRCPPLALRRVSQKP